MSEKSKISKSETQKELEKVEAQFDEYDRQVKQLTMDQMNKAPKQEVEPQTKIAQKDMDKQKNIYLKPVRTIPDRQKFNERFREQWNFAKEYVHFIAENKEIIGETIEMWTHPYGGVGAEFWQIPCNKLVWAPRYVAEQIARKLYHKLVMQQTVQGQDGMGQYYGSMVADTTIARFEAKPVSTRKSIFMGAEGF